MRTKSGRWTSGRGVFTFSVGMELAGITGDFSGGFSTVNATAMEVNPGSSHWISLQVHVDGVIQGPARIIWQATGQSNVQVSLNHSVRVPPGRHRVGVILGSSSSAAWNGNGGAIEVVEQTA